MEYAAPIEAAPMLIEARSRRRDSRRNPTPRRSRTAPAMIIGAIVLLDDGTKCRVEYIDRTKNRFYCIPLKVRPMTRTIDLTPTWKEAAHIIAAVLENGTHEGRQAARAELFKMAEILDEMKERQKEKA